MSGENVDVSGHRDVCLTVMQMNIDVCATTGILSVGQQLDIDAFAISIE